MEITTILQWLAAWGLLLLAQSIFINGVYQSATGETKKRVDGSDEDSEMILYPVKKFFEKLKDTHVTYKGYELDKLRHEISTQDPTGHIYDMICTDDGLEPRTENDKIWIYKVGPIIESRHDVIVKQLDGKYKFVKVYKDYFYSKWLRKPIIQCIKCMASFWGALTFWPVVLFIFGFNWWEIPVFFADMFSLTYLNWILYLKAQK